VLPQSKTLARQPTNPIQLVGYSIFETALISFAPSGQFSSAFIRFRHDEREAR